MSFLENILYGFVSGITEFLPVSSRAHQVLLRYILGVNSRNFIQEFLVHIGLLFSIIICCRDVIFRLRRERKSLYSLGYRKKKTLDPKSYFDIRLLKTATIPLVIGLCICFVTIRQESKLISVLLFLLLNGVVLLVADHTQRGNRDSRTMTGLDGILMGILGSLSAFPGISRTGMISSYAAARGADSENISNWTFLLGIPAIVFFLCFDIFGIITVGIGNISLSAIMGFLFAGVAAFCGGYIAISAFKAILNHAGFSQFAYYSFGAAFLTFIIYLIT